MTHARLILAALLLTPALHAEATRQDWIGDYTIDHDGHPGTLHITPSRRKCAPGQCTGLDAQYADQNGTAYPTAVNAFDQGGQHLALTVSFPGNAQPFDLYIFSFEKSRLAGTTVWQGRTFGVSAVRAGASSSAPQKPAGAGSKMTVGTDGIVTMRLPDGTVKTRALNGCGWDITLPSGRLIKAQCVRAAVIPIVPPDPPPGSSQGRWLQGQDDTLLAILQSMLDPASYQNYLNNYENTPGTALYKQVYFRTKAIADFTAP